MKLSCKTNQVICRSALILIAFASLSMGQFLTISGVVRDSLTSSPVSGAVVLLPKLFKSDTTDAAGAFSLVFTSVIGNVRPHLGSVPAVVHNGLLSVALDKSERMSIQAFALNGKMVSSVSGDWQAGSYRVPFSNHPSGIYLYRIQIGNRYYSMKFTYMDAGRAGPASMQTAPWPPAGAPSLEKGAAPAAIQDTLQFSKDGYYRKKVPIAYASANLTVSMRPVVLKNGVRPGEWDLGSYQGLKAFLYVNQNRRSVDSMTFNVTMQCIQATHDFSYTVTGPFAIPQNGVVAIGDSIRLNFLDSSATATFNTRQVISMTTSQQCEWSEIIYFGSSGYMIQTYTHYDHQFSLKMPVFFTSTVYSLQTSAVHGHITKYPDKPFYMPNETVQLSAVPDSIYRFTGWNGLPYQTTKDTASIVMDGPKTISATFAQNYVLTTSIQNGYLYTYPQLSSFAPGDTVKLVATPMLNYCCPRFSGDTSRMSGDTAWVIMTGPKMVSVALTHVVYLMYTADHGSVSMAPQKEYFLTSQKDTVKLIAKPDSGYQFISWSGETFKVSKDTAWVVMDTTKTVAAKFLTDKISRVYHENAAHIFSVGFSPDGSKVALGAIDSVAIFDKNTGAFIRHFGSGMHFVYALQFSSDNSHVLTGSFWGAVDLWDVTTGAKVKTYTTYLAGQSVAFSPDYSKVLSGGFKITKLWDAGTGNELFTFACDSSMIKAIAFSTDGSRILTGAQTGRFWDAATGALLSTVTGASDMSEAIAFCPDGTSYQSMSSYGTWQKVDIATGTVVKNFETGFDPTCAAFSPDGFMVAYGTWNRGVKVWETATGKLLQDCQGHTSPVEAIAFSPDGSQILTGAMDNSAILWNVK